MQAVPLALMGVSAVVGAGGALATGNQNAKVLQAKAAEEQAQGVAERAQIRAAARAAMGRQVAAAAESGFAPGVGSALTDLEESLVNRELDLLTSKRNAASRAAGLQQQAKFAKREGQFGAAASILDGATKMFGYASSMGNAGK